jgi:hypothetical protein
MNIVIVSLNILLHKNIVTRQWHEIERHFEIDFSLISYKYQWDVKTFTSLLYKRRNLSPPPLTERSG